MLLRCVISVDSGGTFLDVVIVDADGRVGAGKALHTPEQPEIGILQAISVAAGSLGADPEEVLENCRLFYNGTTCTTNAIIEGTGAVTGLLCTKGFEDTIFIGRIKGRTVGLEEIELTRYTRMDRPPALIPFRLIKGVTERIDYAGNIVCPLDPDEIRRMTEELLEDGVQSVAVCYLHAYVNPEHEEMTKRFIREHYPELHVVTSSEVAPVLGEYERMNSTVINAKLNPVLGRYLDQLESALHAKGYRRETMVMKSVGGVSPSGEIRNQSITTLLSGPAGGIIGARQVGEMIGEPNIITTDMGGTSFDVGVIYAGQPQYASQLVIHRQIVLAPSVEIATIGAGGGSIVWLDDNLNIRIGPRSAGAYPGPACYGLGGTEPTITDADLLLGFIDPSSLVLSRSSANPEAAERVIREKISEPLGISPMEAAHAISRIVNNHMADLIRKSTIEKGFDPREFALLAYGGNGPMHCTAYGAEVGVKKIIIPQYASIFSAYGISCSDVKYSYTNAVLLTFRQDAGADESVKLEALNRRVLQLQEKALAQGGLPGGEMERQTYYELDMRFKGQMSEVTIRAEETFPIGPAVSKALLERFKNAYEVQYGSGASSSRSPIEIVNVRLNIIVPLPKSQAVPEPLADKNPAHARTGKRRVYWDNETRWQATDVYDVNRLLPGNEIEGPALVDMFRSTVPVYAGQRLRMDAWRNLIVELQDG